MTLVDVLSPTKAAKAAAWAIQARDRSSRQLTRPIHSNHPNARALSLRDLAERLNVPKSTLALELAAIRQGKPDARSATRRGRPSLLTDSEDKALVLYITLMSKGAFPITKLMVRLAINELLARRTPPRKPVSSTTMTKIWKDRPELHITKTIAVDIHRLTLEEQINSIDAYYTLRTNTIHELNIQQADDWNADETGIRLGCVSGNTEVVVIAMEEQLPTVVADFSNRETSTCVGSGSAMGRAIPPYMIFKTWPSVHWAYVDVNSHTRFTRSENGFSTKEIQVDYLKHFNKYSFERSSTFERLQNPITGQAMTLQEWFGVDECGETPDGRRSTHTLEGGMKRFLNRDPIWRLLTLDNFTGHISIEAGEYCLQYDIMLLFMPPHSTHLLQPLDLTIFRVMKAKHQRILQEHIHQGEVTFSRTDFVTALDEIYGAGFTTHNLMSAFERAGYYPFNPNLVIEPLKAKLAKSAIPKIPSFLPRGDELTVAKDAADYLYDHHVNVTNPLLSSPSRQALRTVCETPDKAIVLKRNNDDHVRRAADRKDMFAKRARRRYYKPAGWRYDSVSAGELRERQAAEREAERDKQRQREIRGFRAQERARERQLREEWRPMKRQFPLFKDWLLEVKGIDDWIPCGRGHPLWADGDVRQRKPTFYVDTTARPMPPWLKYTRKPLTFLNEPPPNYRGRGVDGDVDSAEIGTEIGENEDDEVDFQLNSNAGVLISENEFDDDEDDLPSSPPVVRRC